MGGFGFSFGAFNILFSIGFIAILALIIITVIRSISQGIKNNRSPVLTVAAMVSSKRQDTHHHHSTDPNMPHFSSSTSYYVTFEVPSGDRMEFYVPSKEYGLLAEGDYGMLTFQGTRFLEFQRER